MQTVEATVENSMEFPQKTKKLELPYDPVIPFLGIYMKKPKTLNEKNIYTPIFTATLFIMART